MNVSRRSKIIDSDIAFDTYHGIMELFDMGENLSAIQEAFPIRPLPDFDDLENEMYVTAAALAYWELGYLTKDDLTLVKEIVSKSASLTAWTEFKERYGKARQTELDKFLAKISVANNRIRKRNSSSKSSHLYFHPNDILAFKHEDGNYGLALCYDILKDGRKFYYMLSPLIYRESDLPDLEQISSLDYFDSHGLVTIGIEHSTMANLLNRFSKFTEIQLKKSLLQTGRLSFGFRDEKRLFGDVFYDVDYKVLNHVYKARPLISLTD